MDDAQEEDRRVTRGMPIWQTGSGDRFVRKRTTVKTDNIKRLQVRKGNLKQIGGWINKLGQAVA